MSRHRRQASQVLPPEIIAGDELSKPLDLSQFSAGRAAGDANTQEPRTTGQQKETTLAQSTAATKKPPPAGKSG